MCDVNTYPSQISHNLCYDNVFIWKRLPHNWPFVLGIHRSLLQYTMLLSEGSDKLQHGFNILFSIPHSQIDVDVAYNTRSYMHYLDVVYTSNAQ